MKYTSTPVHFIKCFLLLFLFGRCGERGGKGEDSYFAFIFGRVVCFRLWGFIGFFWSKGKTNRVAH